MRSTPARRTRALFLATAATATALTLAAPAHAAGSLTITGATVSDTGQALVTVSYTCPDGKGIWGAGFHVRVNVDQNDVTGTDVQGVCADGRTGTATLRANGRTGSGITGHDAKYIKGKARISAFITDTLQGPDIDHTPITVISAAATQLT
ncbi:hypothetical protein GCM10010371_69990 [Streptomyces subrutilus]|uniref:Secreted protein n=1 Tax=Streptomyces subrutilus TaxID=36818 RepID=A0A918RJF7_9ACTN|nr:hypothetical protein [Streptomyces subrutilus]GHA01249.1 hypothetical protein GCM10010371_69990 [Streptomyces subrutilus]